MKQVTATKFDQIKRSMEEAGEVTSANYGNLTEYFSIVGLFGFELNGEFFSAFGSLVE